MDQFEIATEANDAYRRALMNVKYYGSRLARLQKLNRTIEIIVAVGTSGSIASLAVWHTTAGQAAFAVVAGVSAILSVAKPVLNLSGDISRCSKLWAAYNSVEIRLERVSRDMRLNKQVRPEMMESINAAMESIAALKNDEDPQPDEELLEKSLNEVEKEIPQDRLFWPISAEVSAVETGAVHAVV